MKIYLTRHGQTRLNRAHLMQGRTDEPLNATGRAQAKAAREALGDITFDAVYASPLDRAIETASIIGNVDRGEIIVDERIIEADFGTYEQKKYYAMGPAMSLYWACPEIFPVPKGRGVESIASLVERSSSFLKELEQKEYDTVLIACHGGIMRALSGYLMDRKNGIYWRPKPHNCEIRVFETDQGMHRFVESIRPNLKSIES